MLSPTLALTKALIACRSQTPDDAGCQQLLIDRLQPLGFTIERIRSGEVDNFWARRGTASPVVCFAGHTDVVPSGPIEKWHSEPFTPTEKDGKLYGRGAADMKASLAAFVTGIERFVASHPDHAGSIALIITSDEEGPATDGTVKVVEALKARGELLDFCIVGEPTSADAFGDTIKNGRRGSLSGKLNVIGVQGHVAYPQRAKNPIHLAAPAIAELAATEWDQGDAHFPPTTFQISNMHGGTGAGNIIPGAVEIRFNLRFAAVSSADSLMERIHLILNRHGLQYELDWELGAKPFITQPGKLTNALTQAIHAVTGKPPELSTTGGTSDGRFIIDICKEVAEFGPVNRSIHKVNECVALDEIEPLSQVYTRALEALLVK